MPYVFTNNAAAVLTTALNDVETVIAVSYESASRPRFATESVAEAMQPLTITSLEHPGEFEIVHMQPGASADTLTVVRGAEGTTARAWPAGAAVSARVTAGMLDAFTQKTDEFHLNDGALRTGGGLRVNSLDLIGGDNVQIMGWPALQHARNDPWAYGASTSQEAAFAREIVGGSPFLGLGTVPVWTAGTSYFANALVRPATDTGYQYWLTPATSDNAIEVVNAASPAFDIYGSTLEARPDGSSGGDYAVWFAVPYPGPVEQAFDFRVQAVITEVGFICRRHGGGSAPVVSIGVAGDSTRFANNVTLNQITGANQIHRIPVTAGGALVEGLFYTTASRSSDVFDGVFYWRGFALQRNL